MRVANALRLDTTSEPDGSVTVRLPRPGRFRVHVEVTWDPAEPDRKAVFDEVRRRGNPVAVAMLDRLGEDAIANPEGLLVVGSIDDPTLERPPQPPPDEREPVE
jgi:hypothetical protein